MLRVFAQLTLHQRHKKVLLFGGSLLCTEIMFRFVYLNGHCQFFGTIHEFNPLGPAYRRYPRCHALPLLEVSYPAYSHRGSLLPRLTPHYCREHLREFPLEMIFNIVYHTPGAAGSVPEEGAGDGGVSIEVQMAWGGASIYTFQVNWS